MLFNSIEFALFLPLVLLGYWMIPSSRIDLRNAFLVVASYVFYGWWDSRFLFLIILSSLVDFSIGLALVNRTGPARKWLLAISILVNLGILGVFKYAGFFLGELSTAFTFLGHPLDIPSLSIVLPVGISFYTFQTMSYTIDVYRKRIQPETNLTAFLAFVSFFPQLVAGPIERAAGLLPQFHRTHRVVYGEAVDALRQMLWGLFKKVAVADQCARFVDIVFTAPDAYAGWPLVLGAVLFAFQIYCDFSGYSDIAIGTARLFGFKLMKNFDLPYFSRDIAEFWRRWHISLSTWFRDYLYIPLGGSRGTRWMRIRNVFIIFLVSGLWHGANWTFIIWGAIHAMLFLPLLLGGLNRRNMGAIPSNRTMPKIQDLGAIMLTFSLTTVAWIFFRANDLAGAWHYLLSMFRTNIGSTAPDIPLPLFLVVPILLAIEWRTRHLPHPLAIAHWTLPVRWATYTVLCTMSFFMFEDETTFIYFQF